MKAVVSSTHDDKYMYFLPIVTWLWNKLGVDVICFMPYLKDGTMWYNPDKAQREKYSLIIDTLDELNIELEAAPFLAPEHKQATYAQCARLYAACLDLPEDEILIIGDIDMGMFHVPSYMGGFTIFGSDLVPDKQYPMCFISASVKDWKAAFCGNKTYQECLDELLGHIETLHFRGNYWGKDQETAYSVISNLKGIPNLIPRTNGQNPFSTLRYDRDDAYLLDRLSLDTIDYHMPRPGYEENNFNQILTVLKFHYPDEDFTWLINYNEAYKKLL